MRVIHGHKMANRMMGMSKSRYRIAKPGMLGKASPVGRVKPVNAVVIGGAETKVDRPTIQLNGCGRRADKPRCPGRIEKIRLWDKIDQPPYDRVRCGRALDVAQNDAIQCDALSMSYTLIC